MVINTAPMFPNATRKYPVYFHYPWSEEDSVQVKLPDDYEFPRSWTESMRQLGNAVPAPLGAAAGSWLVKLASGKAAMPLALEGVPA